MAALAAARNVARDIGAALFLAGGSVRDLLLGRPSLDIDLAVEGDIDRLAAGLAAATGYRIVRHGRFGTATLRGAGFTIDFARSRRETYARPGALPAVEPASIEEDLARRDFTINAMALRLTAPAGELLDRHGGRVDLERRLVRVLHDRSFQDDATRMLRACRYSARLGFALDPATASLIRRDLAYLDTLTGPRLRHELTRTLKEPSAPDAVILMARLNLLSAIHPLLTFESPQAPAPAAAPPPQDYRSGYCPVPPGLGARGPTSPGSGTRCRSVPQDWGPGGPSPQDWGLGGRWRAALEGEHHAPVEELGYCMLSACRDQGDVAALTARLHLHGKVQAALNDLVRLAPLSDKLDQQALRPSEVSEALAGFAPASVWAFGLRAGGRAAERCLAYLGHWRRVRPALDGFDLAAWGLAGVDAGAALKRLRRARLDGEVTSREDEIELIRREFPSATPGPASPPPSRRRR